MFIDILLAILIFTLIGSLMNAQWRWILLFCISIWTVIGWMAYIAYNRI